jgi:hypothetical protein
MTKLADHINGSKVGDKELVQQLIRWARTSSSLGQLPIAGMITAAWATAV